MPKKQMVEQEHFVYKWTHEEGFYYIGKHSGKEDDGYVGSGVLFKKLFLLDKTKWNREIVARYPQSSIALDGEKRVVGDRWKTDPLCLNVCPGGRIHNKAMLGYYKEKLNNLVIFFFLNR